MQIHLLSNFVNQLTLKRQNLLLKIGIILIIVICSTSEVVVSRIAEEETEPKKQTQTDPATPENLATVPDSGTPKYHLKIKRNTGFGLFTRNPFDNDSKSKHFIWQEEKEHIEVPDQIEEEDRLIQPYLDSLRRWRNPPYLTDLNKLYNWKPKPSAMKKALPSPWIPISG